MSFICITFSFFFLLRRRMRCTTNIYLTALAITDIIYLTMALLLSLQHYNYVHLYCKIYWMCYGVVVWLCDACCKQFAGNTNDLYILNFFAPKKKKERKKSKSIKRNNNKDFYGFIFSGFCIVTHHVMGMLHAAALAVVFY